MKSFPAHYHLVEFIYSTLNFNSREQALVTKQENHRFISIESIIDYFTRCKECKFEITAKEREREKFWILNDFINAFRGRREDDQRIQPARGTLLLTNKKILSP